MTSTTTHQRGASWRSGAHPARTRPRSRDRGSRDRGAQPRGPGAALSPLSPSLQTQVSGRRTGQAGFKRGATFSLSARVLGGNNRHALRHLSVPGEAGASHGFRAPPHSLLLLRLAGREAWGAGWLCPGDSGRLALPREGAFPLVLATPTSGPRLLCRGSWSPGPQPVRGSGCCPTLNSPPRGPSSQSTAHSTDLLLSLRGLSRSTRELDRSSPASLVGCRCSQGVSSQPRAALRELKGSKARGRPSRRVGALWLTGIPKGEMRAGTHTGGVGALLGNVHRV